MRIISVLNNGAARKGSNVKVDRHQWLGDYNRVLRSPESCSVAVDNERRRILNTSWPIWRKFAALFDLCLNSLETFYIPVINGFYACAYDNADEVIKRNIDLTNVGRFLPKIAKRKDGSIMIRVIFEEAEGQIWYGAPLRYVDGKPFYSTVLTFRTEDSRRKVWEDHPIPGKCNRDGSKKICPENYWVDGTHRMGFNYVIKPGEDPGAYRTFNIGEDDIIRKSRDNMIDIILLKGFTECPYDLLISKGNYFNDIYGGMNCCAWNYEFSVERSRPGQHIRKDIEPFDKYPSDDIHTMIGRLWMKRVSLSYTYMKKARLDAFTRNKGLSENDEYYLPYDFRLPVNFRKDSEVKLNSDILIDYFIARELGVNGKEFFYHPSKRMDILKQDIKILKMEGTPMKPFTKFPISQKTDDGSVIKRDYPDQYKGFKHEIFDAYDKGADFNQILDIAAKAMYVDMFHFHMFASPEFLEEKYFENSGCTIDEWQQIKRDAENFKMNDPCRFETDINTVKAELNRFDRIIESGGSSESPFLFNPDAESKKRLKKSLYMYNSVMWQDEHKDEYRKLVDAQMRAAKAWKYACEVRNSIGM